jgi:myo-inositol-1(or 4)-monophosphatase
MRGWDRRNDLKVESKGKHDFVSEIDHKAEQVIMDEILKNYPNHKILGEESGLTDGKEDVVWIVDPLDGTTNFLRGIPHFAVSIGVQVKGKLEHGVVYDPVRDELFTASRGKGAQLDGYRIRTSSLTTLDEAILATGLHFRNKERYGDAYFGMLTSLFSQSGDIRRAGSAALDLAYLAAGRVDGYWEIGLKPWDIAAGAVLVQESGGAISTFGGNPQFLDKNSLIAAPVKLFKPMLKALAPHTPESLK